jgi:hypothetical protein
MGFIARLKLLAGYNKALKVQSDSIRSACKGLVLFINCYCTIVHVFFFNFDLEFLKEVKGLCSLIKKSLFTLLEARLVWKYFFSFCWRPFILHKIR